MCFSECYSLLNGAVVNGAVVNGTVLNGAVVSVAVLNTAVCKLCFIFQSLYGPRKSHPPALCSNSSFDAIFEYPAGIIYVLKGKLNTVYCKIRISPSSAAEVSSRLGCEGVLVGDFSSKWF
jgi:hypothetical protein